MQKQTIEKSDETIGIKAKVEKHNKSQNRIRFKNSFANIGDEVALLTLSEHSNYLQLKKDADNYITTINQLQDEIDNNDINALNKQLTVYEKQVDKLTKSNNSFKQWNDEYKAKNKELSSKLDKYKETIADKDATILELKKDNKNIVELQNQLQDKDATITSLTSENNQLKFSVSEQSKTISSNDTTIEDLEQTIAELKEHNDAIAKQLEDSIDASEHQQLQDKVAELQSKVGTSESVDYWKNAYENIVASSDELANRNDELVTENNDLKNKVDAVNNTNQYLNQSLLGLKDSFDETIEDITTDSKNKEKELKETIKNQQSHIDEITKIKDSLLVKNEYIPTKQHYDEILALTNELNDAQKEIDKLNSDIEVKLATQKSELDSEHADAVNKIQLENTENKAQLLVAYNNDLNNLKIQYNNLANGYNHLLDELDSITKWNALFDSRHKKIRKDKEPVPPLEITSEQLPPSDEHVLEYIPKE